MRQLTQYGATVEQAIALALEELQLSRDEVTISILQEPKKGFLGFGAKKAHVQVTEIIKEEPKPAFDAQTELNMQTEQPQKEILTSVDIVEKPVEQISEQSIEEVDFVEKDIPAEPVHKKDHSVVIRETEAYLKNIAAGMGIDDLKITTNAKNKLLSLQLDTKKAALLIGKRGQTLNAIQLLAQMVVYKHSNRFLMIEIDVENYRQKRRESLEVLAERLADKAVATRKKVELEPMPSNERKIIHNVLAKRLDVDTFSKGDHRYRHIVIEPIK